MFSTNGLHCCDQLKASHKEDANKSIRIAPAMSVHHQGAGAREPSTPGLLHNGNRLGLDGNLKYQASLLPTLLCVLDAAKDRSSSWQVVRFLPGRILGLRTGPRLFWTSSTPSGFWGHGGWEREAESVPDLLFLPKALRPTLYLLQVYMAGTPKNIGAGLAKHLGPGE